MKIHSTAIIDKKAKLSDNVEVGPYAVIGPDVQIGSGTSIGAHCVIERYVTIGKNCKIYPSSVIGSVTQDLKFKGEISFVEIGNNNSIREFVTINRGTGKRSVTRLGDNNLIMACVHVAHDCSIGNNVIIANCGTLAGYVTIEDRAMIGGLSGIHQFVRVGMMSIIGGCSKVVKHIPPFAMADGQPSRVYGLNIVGLNRAGVASKSKLILKRAFRILFNSGLSLPHALERIADTLPPTKEIKHLVAFLTTVKNGTKRGVCK